MLISKFNRMVRSRALWAVFAVIVSICFVGAFSGVGGARGGGCSAAAKGGVGVLFGEPVSGRDFNLARYFAVGLREPPNRTAESERMIHRMTWRRLAALRMAERMGLAVADDELRTQLQRDPTFQVNGAFSRERYRAIMDAQRLTPTVFEQYLREELTLRKLFGVLDGAVWSPASEMERRVRNLSDRFDVQYTFLDAAKAEPAQVTEQEARAYYERNPDRFHVSKRLTVRYVEFAVSNYFGKVAVTESELGEAYSNQVTRFTTADTNGVAVTRPFAEVRDELLTEMRQLRARVLAKDDASALALDLTPYRQEPMKSFEATALAKRYAVQTSGWFSARGEVPGLDAPPAFISEAFKLDGTADHYFSDPVIGEDAVYILATNECRAAFLPAFSNVLARAMTLAGSNATHAAFLAKAEDIRKNVAQAVTSGMDFTAALKRHNLTVKTNLTFVAQESSPDQIEHFYTLVPQTIALQPGEVSSVLEVEGGALIAHVKGRESGDAISVQLLKPRVAETMDRMRASFLFEDWADYVLNVEGRFKDLAVGDKTDAGTVDPEGESDETEAAADSGPGT